MQTGTQYSYISSTFLDGWINYVKILDAYLVTRYRPHSKNKQAAKLFNDGGHFHTELSKLGDDVFILAEDPCTCRNGCVCKSPYHYSKKWFFRYDCDVSDCSIGIINPYDSFETNKELFGKYANKYSLYNSKGYSDNEGFDENSVGWPALRLNAQQFKGWISW